MRLSSGDGAVGSSGGGSGNIPGPVVFGVQSFTLNGGTQTIADTPTSGAVIFISGSTAGSTIDLPSAVTAGAGATFFLAVNTTAPWTIGATAGNVDGAATKTMNGSAVYESNGTNWISSSVTSYFGDARWGQLAAANAWTAANSFAAQFALGTQSFSASGTISDAAGSVVTYKGTTSAQTLLLPASPTINRLIYFRNESTQTVTISGNGVNIDSTASVVCGIPGGGLLWYDGTQWWTIGPASWPVQAFQSTNTFNGTTNLSGAANIKALNLSRQSFSGSGSPSSTAGNIWAVTGTAGGTLTGPASPTSDLFVIVKDEGGNAGTNNITFNSNSLNIDGAPTKVINTNFGAIRMYFNGVAWFSC